MAAEKDVLGLIDLGREVRRAPLVGMEFLHERAVSFADLLFARSHLKTQDLIRFLFGDRSRSRRSSLPRMRVSLRCLTPAGKAAVEIHMK